MRDRSVKIRAVYEEDERQYIDIFSCLTDGNYIDIEKAASGIARDWEESKNSYTLWRFILSFDDDGYAYMEWESGHQAATIDILGKHMVAGATFTRFDGLREGSSRYLIDSIEDA